MKASELLKKIQDELKDYPIEYLKNKATDDRSPDSITKKLAKYNSNVYDDIYKQPARKTCSTIFLRGMEKIVNGTK